MCHEDARVAIAAPTSDDCRKVCIEGESGLLSVLPDGEIGNYNRQEKTVRLKNGTIIQGYSAEEPNRFRGPQHHRAWCDELAAWRYTDAWDQLMFGMRLGDNPQVVVTTTPRPTALIRSLAKDRNTIITRGNTFDNAANLAPSALARLREKYEGTRLGRQELFAEILDDVPGALWTRDMVPVGPAPAMQRVVVAVDPSGTSGAGDGADAIGIVVAGKGIDGRFYVLEDATCDLSPEGWGRRVVDRYRAFAADRIVAERNFGGDMVAAVIRMADRSAPVKLVTASRGKSVRAEPIAALYEQGRVTHAPGLEALEDQMMQMTPSGYVGEGSPDRLDAMVWALTELSDGGETVFGVL